MMQYLVRAPGYTIKVDARSGVSYYLLDAHGHPAFPANKLQGRFGLLAKDVRLQLTNLQIRGEFDTSRL